MTNLIRWTPVRELDLPRSVNTLFHDLFREFPLSDGSVFDHKAWAPAVDVEEREDAYVVTADVPGLDRKDVRRQLGRRRAGQ